MSEFVWSKENNRCFGCGDNPWGLQLDFSSEEDWVVAKSKLDSNYQGFQGAAHGGIVATMLDEAGAWAVAITTGYLAPSFELTCKFLKPVPLGSEVTVYGRVVDRRHSIITSEAKIVEEKAGTLATAEIKSKILENSVKVDE